MSPDELKGLIRGFVQDLARGDVVAAAAKFDAEEYYSHTWGGNLLETWTKMQAQSGALTDPSFEIQDLVADGDRVVARSTLSFTHSGPLFGVPATGRRYSFTQIEMWRVEGGRIVEHWGGIREAIRLFEALCATA